MDDLRALIAGDQPVAGNQSQKIPKQVQQSRDVDAIAILQKELAAAQARFSKSNDPRDKEDVDSATREIVRLGGSAQAMPSATPQAPSDPLRDLISGAPASPDLYAAGAVTPQTHLTPQQMEAAVKTVQPSAATQALQRAFQLKQRAPNEIASALDVVGNLPSQFAGTVGYGAGRLFGLNPQEATAAAAPVSQALANPVGRLMGVTDQPGYQSSLPAMAQQAIGGVMQKGAEAVGQRTGINPTDIEQGVTAAMMAAPMLKTPLGRAGAAIKSALPEYTIESPTTAATANSVGAAATNPANVLRTNINATLANASPELNQLVQSKNPASINLHALETKALEEKHGIDLTTSQRLGDTPGYAESWNRRAETPALSNRYEQQPKQVADAFEALKEKHAPDINPLADASELGQHEINALAEKDALRRAAISDAYQKLKEANGGQFPIDVQALDKNVNDALSQNLKTNHLRSSIASDLQDFYKDPTFEKYEALRTNLATEMRSNSNGNARGAAYVVRQQLENLPVFGEENAAFNPQAAQLKQLADNARRLVAERANVIKNNPAYRKAIGEAEDVNSAVSQGESLNAAKFHNQFVSNATPEAIRRMKSEIAPDNIAHQAITFGELNRAKNAAVSAKNDLTPATLATFLQKNKPSLNQSLAPEAMQGVSEIGALASKIGQPKTGVFSHSNTYSAMIGGLAKEGLTSAAEAKLAMSTGGASIPVVSMVRQFAQKHSKNAFAQQEINPLGGITKD